MVLLNEWKKVFVFALLGVMFSIVSPAQTFKTLVIFDDTNGERPVDTPLVQGIDGNLYGTTLGGGANESGTVFRLTPAGKLTTLYSFCSQPSCVDGTLPYGGLVLGTDGNFYGTTSQGGTAGFGVVFRINLSGTLTTLHSFQDTDGAGPAAPLIQATNGYLYGITMNGGPLNAGTIFKISLSGVLTTLHTIAFGEGSFLNGPLVLASDGNFYGTTELGGANGLGTIFKVTPSGTFTTFHSFDGTDGSAPACGLLQASDGMLYGTAYQGGADNSCENGCGTVFKITLAGVLATMHSFNSTDGGNPIAGLIQATDGNFYGTTYAGGTAGDWGTVFKITPNGTVTTLHSFDGNDGAQPYGPVSQTTNGNLYGTATNGLNAAADGTVFGVSTGFIPFVSFNRPSGKVGQVVGILGQGFAGTTSVIFNGLSASFTVKSGTFLTATIPAGATTGFVKVTTPNATLKSNVPFRILQ